KRLHNPLFSPPRIFDKARTVTYVLSEGMCRHEIKDAPEKAPLPPVAVAAGRLGRDLAAAGFSCPGSSRLGPLGSVSHRRRLPATDRGSDYLPSFDLRRPPSRGLCSFFRPDFLAGRKSALRPDLSGSAPHADVLAIVRSGFCDKASGSPGPA